MKIHPRCVVTSLTQVAKEIYVLRFRCPEIAATVRAGQFINIKVHEFYQPLLRRPFSVYNVDGEEVEILFNVIGAGTRVLYKKHVGDAVDILGPLGNPFGLDGPYETAIFVGGGLGVAPFPLATRQVRGHRRILTLLGARNSSHIVPLHLENLHIATDDGSAGFHGTVVDLLAAQLQTGAYPSPKIFGCGPTPMLMALARTAARFGIPCEASLESAMACGIGICQGCPIEHADADRKYALICKEGPVFDTQKIWID